VYSFATLNPQTLTIEASIPEIDFTENMYAQVTGLKSNSKGLRVSLALGGWADSANSQKYSQLINNGSARAQFVHNTAKFLEKHNFDGLDMDWEYPRCWHGNCTAGPISDRNNFASLIRELHVAFRQKHFLLSVAVSASRFVSEQGKEYENYI
jgi:chitinase